MPDNNNTSIQSNMSQPTIADVYNLLTKSVTDLSNQMSSFTAETTNKLQIVNDKVDCVNVVSSQNTDRIESLEATVECLKQKQLKNNMCISGVPPELVKDNKSAAAVIAIAKTLGVEIAQNNFSSYTKASNKFIIVHFYNTRHKQSMMNKIRVKKSLMVEECFEFRSNSQVYLNDHLTPYFNSLFLMARKAKKDGKLASASSYGGRIRARRSTNDPPIIITSEKQLQALIDYEYDSVSDDENSIQLLSSDMETSNASANDARNDASNNSNNDAVQTISTKKSKGRPPKVSNQNNNNNNAGNSEIKRNERKSSNRNNVSYGGNKLGARKRKIETTDGCTAQAKKNK